MDNTDLNESCECNIHLNDALKALKEENRQEAKELLKLVISITEMKFKALSDKKNNSSFPDDEVDRYSPEYYNNKELFLDTLLPIFDIFFSYGRIFGNQNIKNLLKEVCSECLPIFYSCVKISKFVMDLIDNPTKSLRNFSPIEVRTILSGLFSPMGVRIPEISDLVLNSNFIGHLHRESVFYTQVSKYFSLLKTDKFNKEYYKKSEEIIMNSSKHFTLIYRFP